MKQVFSLNEDWKLHKEVKQEGVEDADNFDMFSKILPFARKYNIKIATETFGDAVGVKGERQPSDHAEDHLTGEENQSHVVDEHGHGGDEL